MILRSSDLSHDEIKELVGRDDPVIIEIGCNDGTDTLEMLKRFPKADITCFECDPRAIEAWRRNVGDDEYRAVLFNVALDVTSGIKKFHQSNGSPYHDKPDYDWSKSGSLCKPTGHLSYSKWCRFDNSIDVQCCTLDGIVGTFIKRYDYIRADVQGAELRVFSGGEETLKRTRLVQAECHPQAQMYEGAPREPEMLAFFAERGFRCLGRYADDLLFRREP